MAYRWQEKGDSDGPTQAEKIPAGVWDLKIIKVVFGKKGGKAFMSKGGAPQIMCVFANDAGEEAAQMYTLSDSAGWTLAQLLGAAGANLAQMELDGVEIESFAEPKFAHANLVGRRLQAEVAWDDDGYSTITPIRRDPTAEPAPPLDPNDIPI